MVEIDEEDRDEDWQPVVLYTSKITPGSTLLSLPPLGSKKPGCPSLSGLPTLQTLIRSSVCGGYLCVSGWGEKAGILLILRPLQSRSGTVSHSTIGSILDRIEGVIAAQGGHTRWWSVGTSVLVADLSLVLVQASLPLSRNCCANVSLRPLRHVQR